MSLILINDTQFVANNMISLHSLEMLCLVHAILLCLLICLPDIFYIIIEHEKKNRLENYFCNSFVDGKPFFMYKCFRSLSDQQKQQRQTVFELK